MISEQTVIHRVLILADESADWRVAGLSQLHRILLCLKEYAEAAGQRVPISVSLLWKQETAADQRRIPDDPRLASLEVANCTEECFRSGEPFDLVLSTRVFLYRNSIAPLLKAVRTAFDAVPNWDEQARQVRLAIESATERTMQSAWQYLPTMAAIPACERAFLRRSGKSQDGIISRHLNRPISRSISHWLLKTRMMPSTWSVLIFSLPLLACVALVQGSPIWFIVGFAIFQLYSILDGCDGEIARAKFLHTNFGRRLDSLLDLAGNVLLVLCLGIGLARAGVLASHPSWFYLVEGFVAAAFVVLSEGIVFLRRSRRDEQRGATALNGALYQRHQEFFQRSGILVFGENVAWWLVFLTKRDMAMLGFLVLAAVGWPQMILHLMVAVGAVNSALAGNAFFRAPAPALQQEAS